LLQKSGFSLCLSVSSPCLSMQGHSGYIEWHRVPITIGITEFHKEAF